MTKRRQRGRQDNFTPAQNKALRATLQDLQGKYTTQTALAEAIGVGQQTVGRLLNDRRAGLSFMTATAVARLAGFTGVDAFFAAKGVTPESSTVLEDNSLHARAAS